VPNHANLRGSSVTLVSSPLSLHASCGPYGEAPGHRAPPLPITFVVVLPQLSVVENAVLSAGSGQCAANDQPSRYLFRSDFSNSSSFPVSGKGSGLLPTPDFDLHPRHGLLYVVQHRVERFPVRCEQR